MSDASSFHSSLGALSADIGLVLGSGLSSVADAVTERVVVPFAEIARFPKTPGVSGHGRDLVVGKLGSKRVAILTGRIHAYESGDASVMREPIACLKALGCKALLLTNAAGSLRKDIPAGSLMAISDHINWAGMSPLIGDHSDERFVDMSVAYDKELRAAMQRAAGKAGVTLHEGVYAWWVGPMFETPAEIRAARILGADAIGMSTAPEVILARRMGLRVAAISSITNLAAGMGGELSHAHTKAVAATIVDSLASVVRLAVEEFHV
ncbi:purine-nucleoside phosphorylase [Terrarubrum flagellatum]|uniref:purine-nucleoside phosphorylase n=1 Tax=Terrirubrum flagellatum TaxID=2895980 RepID=UPI0031451ACF